MKTHTRAVLVTFPPALIIAVLLTTLPALGQQREQSKEPVTKASSVPPSDTASKPDTVVMSGVATSARIADPNERVVFSGRVMRMADFVAAVSSSTVEVPRPHSPEKQNREKVPPVPPSQP